MKLICLAALLAVFVPPAQPLRAELPGAREAALKLVADQAHAADVRRTAALVAGDTDTLERLLADGMTYVHADGRAETKEELLDRIRAGTLHYHAINPGPRDLRVIAENVVLVIGSAGLLVGPESRPVPLSIRYLAVFRLDPRRGWQLESYQSTRVAADAAAPASAPAAAPAASP